MPEYSCDFPSQEPIANAARHGTYGINGQYFAYGNGIINGFFPGAVITANYLAGGAASRYPAGTLVAGAFADQFGNWRAATCHATACS